MVGLSAEIWDRAGVGIRREECWGGGGGYGGLCAVEVSGLGVVSEQGPGFVPGVERLEQQGGESTRLSGLIAAPQTVKAACSWRLTLH